MRAVFVHDHQFTVGSDGQVYTRGAFPAGVWERYLAHFERLTVVARRAEGEPIAGQALASHPKVEFIFAPSLSGLGGLLFDSPARAVIASALNGAQAVIARLPSELGLAGVREARRAGLPLAVEVVGCAFDSYFNHGSPVARAYAPAAFMRMRAAVAAAPAAIYVTDRFLQGRYPNRGLTGVASNVLIEGVREAPPPVKETGQLTIGTVGSLTHRYKGVQTALAALQRLGRKDLVYRVLGPGDPTPWQAQARALGVDDQVEFCGALPAGPAVLGWIDELDLYLQPSFQEGLPRGLIEAMSRGKPAIGSSAGGIPELLEREFIHRPGDAARLAELITRLADDPLERSLQAARNLAKARRYTAAELEQRRGQFWGEFVERLPR